MACHGADINSCDDQEDSFDPDEYLDAAGENAPPLNEKLKEALALVDKHYDEALQRLAKEGNDEPCR